MHGHMALRAYSHEWEVNEYRVTILSERQILLT